ncbi:hypothetical protein GCM10010174_21130 [Kutzneria viridogrisea]|uniref:Secreted protein n=2 Tax=Kutzneria TaxID=43356 RepID=W5W0Q0_9PSEU|nr:hypothetical protein [Kutzneria albida]AHH94412.1 hypothetical protein KALB_1039 [Kutzneria albida DSM 43870]MBA8930079.1 hypothetical protein [Kutzneria viridogrisea]
MRSATVLVTGAVLVAGVLTGCSAAAADQPAQPTATSTAKPSHSRKPLPDGETRVLGVVASTSAGQLVVTTKDGGSQTVTTDSATKVTGGPVQQGQRVAVIVKDGKALSVRVGTGNAATTTATPQPTS